MFQKLYDVIQKKDFSGVISIKQDEHLIFHQAFGYANRTCLYKNQVDTAFAIASGTKLFTALGIFKLIERSKLSLSDKVFNYIKNPFGQYQDCTIEHLLSHTSGLPDYYDEDLIEDFDNFKVATPWFELEKPSDYEKIFPNRPMKFNPGEDFQYNNSGYVMLAMVIEAITGNYHAWLKETIFDDCHLLHTGFYRFDNLPHLCATGYLNSDPNDHHSNIYKLPVIGGGDGGLYTTSDDLILVWNQLFRGKLLSQEHLAKLLSNHVPNEREHYGLGVWLSEIDESPYILGSDPGVSFISSHRPKTKITYNILSNTSSGAWHINQVLTDIIKNL